MLDETNRQKLDGIVQQMVANKESDDNIRFVVDDFKKKYDVQQKAPTKQAEFDIPFVPKFAEPAVRGAAKVGEFLGMKPLGTSIAEKVSGVPQTFTKKQVAGSALQTGLLATPLGLPKTLLGKITQFAAVGAGTGFGAGLEQGKDVSGALKQAGETGLISGALPVIGRAISATAKKVAPSVGHVVSSALGSFIGKPPEVIQKAFSDPDVVGKAMAQNKIPEQIRKEGLEFLTSLRSDAGKAFRKGVAEQQALHPFKKTGQTLVKQEFGKLQENISRMVRDNRISITKNGLLNFDKLNSAIISPSERKNVQLAVDTILGQKKFLPKDVQAVSARLSKLSKYADGPVAQSSALVRKIHSLYKEGLAKSYPSLEKVRTEYSAQKKMLDEVGNLLGEGKWKPTAITSAIKRLSNVFHEDNELYISILKKLEAKTGNDFLAELAASEFSKLAPASFGSKIAQAGLLAGGAFVNPLILLAAPLFSPKFVGKATVTAAKTGRVVGQAASIAEPIIPKVASQILK